jgi:hypothetical protein
VPLYEFELRNGDEIISTGTFWSERVFGPGERIDWLPVHGTVRETFPGSQPGTVRLILDAVE